MQTSQNASLITIENARMKYPNFSGAPDNYSRDPGRNFTVFFNAEEGAALADLGWNVKLRKKNEPDDPDEYQMKVFVRFDKKPPRCYLVSSRGCTQLGEGLIGTLDDIEYVNVDMEISGYDWEVNGNRGRRAYLKTIYVTGFESDLDRKYSNLPLNVAGDTVAEREED